MATDKMTWITRLAGIVVVLSGPASAQFVAAPGSPFPVRANPGSIAVGDFNNDLIPDLAIANMDSNDVTVLLGNGTGGFTEASGSPFKVGTNPSAIVAVDFNIDGNLDLAIANFNNNSITVMLGNGTGEFVKQAAGSPFTVGTYPDALAVGDFNNDGNPDLAIANKLDNTVTVLLGNGNTSTAPSGTLQFTAAKGSPFGLGTGASAPSSIAVGDFNQDKHQDLAIANLNTGNVTVLLGNGNLAAAPPGTPEFAQAPGSPFPVFPMLPPAQQNSPSPYPVSLATADFNGDGVLDLAIANEGTNNVSVLLGDINLDGGFILQAAGSPFKVGSEPVSVAACDFNGVAGCDFNKDGNPDLAVGNYVDGTVTVLLGKGNLTGSPAGTVEFIAATGSPFSAGSLPHFVAVGDFNLDGKPDLAVANEGSDNVTVLLNNIYSLTLISAATDVAAAPVAPGSIVTIYGSGLATTATTATTLPLPVNLGQTSVTLTDSTQVQSQVPLLYAGPTQINAEIPQTANPGPATFTIYNGSTSQTSSIMVAPVAPGLFTAKQNGKGVAAAQIITNMPDGFQTVADVFQCAGGPATCIAVPINVPSSVSLGTCYLVLYGTGFRNAAPASVTVTITSQEAGSTPFTQTAAYAGPASSPGLDQVNVLLPPSVAANGLSNVYISVPVPGSSSIAVSNTVTVYIQ